jgi:alpha-1,3-rhamnosyl/mannosyltransferase
LPEAVGQVGLTVDPTSVEELADGIARLLDDDDLRCGLSRDGILRAQTLTWRHTAQSLLSGLGIL